MKSSKRKRCTTNEGTQFLVPVGVTAADSVTTTNLLLTKYDDDENNNNAIIMNRLITQKNTTTNSNSNTNNRQNETQLIKGLCFFFFINLICLINFISFFKIAIYIIDQMQVVLYLHQSIIFSYIHLIKWNHQQQQQ